MSFHTPVFNIPFKNSFMDKKGKIIKDKNKAEIVGNKIPNKVAMGLGQTYQLQIKHGNDEDKNMQKLNINISRKMSKTTKDKQVKEVSKENKPKHGSVTKNLVVKNEVDFYQKVNAHKVMKTSNNGDQKLSLKMCRQNFIEDSPINSKFSDILNHPSPHLSHKESLIWLRERRESGTWVQCNRLNCGKWRYLANVNDPTDMPEKWYCEMNTAADMNNCNAKEQQLNVAEEEDLIHNKYTAGSVVWAKLSGYPWWPAMVDDCVDTKQYYWLDGFSDIPTHYNTVFFDSEEVSRAWIATNMIKPYNKFNKTLKSTKNKGNRRYKSRIIAAIIQADDALQLPIIKRLQKYSFIARYKGPINSPTKEWKLKKRNKQKKTIIHSNFRKWNNIERFPYQNKIYPIKSQFSLEGNALHLNQSQVIQEDEITETKPRKELKIRVERITLSSHSSTAALNGDTVVNMFNFENNMDANVIADNHSFICQKLISHLENKTKGSINDFSVMPSSPTEVCNANFGTPPALSY